MALGTQLPVFPQNLDGKQHPHHSECTLGLRVLELCQPILYQIAEHCGQQNDSHREQNIAHQPLPVVLLLQGNHLKGFLEDPRLVAQDPVDHGQVDALELGRLKLVEILNGVDLIGSH